ncbi:hypothetical protein [Oscillibacter sp.]|uniref:hypothetical protein n=1 Tax=Oscillibacter sp. TaxID=1945593 RepID=UPI00260D04D7|nr:hypothetical protein [Oscillibacter sp.]MDD3346475.1 hypothetical protein [Oscillibacter sp.]
MEKPKDWEAIIGLREHLDQMLEMACEYYCQDTDISKKDFIQHENFENPAGLL